MSSINKKEIEKFSKMATEWWDPKGKFKPLHKFNPIRIKYIKENIINDFKLKNNSSPAEIIYKSKSLKGVMEPFKLLDL